MNTIDMIEFAWLGMFLLIMAGITYWQLQQDKKWREWFVAGIEEEEIWTELEEVSKPFIEKTPKTSWDDN